MKEAEEHRYDDILDLPRPISKKHPPMSLLNRAAQFAPFAALTGHEAAIREAERLTEEEVVSDENRKELLDFRLQVLQRHLGEEPEVTVTYFKPDDRKSGGAYETMTGAVKKVDEYKGELVFTDKRRVALAEVLWMEGRLFDGF